MRRLMHKHVSTVGGVDGPEAGCLEAKENAHWYFIA